MNITINEKSGSGKSTLGKRLADVLKYNFLNLESEKNLTNEIINDLLKNGKYMIENSNMTAFFIPNNEINILLKADLEERIERKFKDSLELPHNIIKEIIEKKDERYKNIILLAQKLPTILDTTNKNV